MSQQVIRIKHYGRWISSVLILIVTGWLIYRLLEGDGLDFAAIGKYVVDPTILRAVLVTLWLTFLGMTIGIVLGVLAAVGRLAANPIVGAFAWLYIWFFRGTPVLVQLIFWFNLGAVFQTLSIPSPFGGVIWSAKTSDVITPLMAALLGLGLNMGAYMAEIVRGGILSVNRGQIEVAQAMGMSRQQIMRHIILPQSLRVIIPPTGNEAISMLKFTSLASVISYKELLGVATDIYSTNLKTLELLTVASIWYLICTSAMSIGQHYLEQKLARGSGISSQSQKRYLAISVLRRIFYAKRGKIEEEPVCDESSTVGALP